MGLRYSSFAGPARGLSDPEDVYVYDIGDEDTVMNGPTPNRDHLVLMWSGREYSKNHTWISAEDKAVLSLEECR
jgi:hypothetical protein